MFTPVYTTLVLHRHRCELPNAPWIWLLYILLQTGSFYFWILVKISQMIILILVHTSFFKINNNKFLIVNRSIKVYSFTYTCLVHVSIKNELYFRINRHVTQKISYILMSKNFKSLPLYVGYIKIYISNFYHNVCI